MTPIVSAQCEQCANFHGFIVDHDTKSKTAALPYCRAYTQGIPMAISKGEHDHRKPYPGDNGIRFEPAKP